MLVPCANAGGEKRERRRNNTIIIAVAESTRDSHEKHPDLGGSAASLPHRQAPSKLAGVLLHEIRADWSLTARLDEHRRSGNSIGLVCALGEQERPTALVSTRILAEFAIKFLLVHLLPHVSNVYLLLPLAEIIELLLAPARCLHVPF